jgi:hypothetical protein
MPSQGFSFLTSDLFLDTIFASWKAEKGLPRSGKQTTPLSHLCPIVSCTPLHKHRDGIPKKVSSHHRVWCETLFYAYTYSYPLEKGQLNSIRDNLIPQTSEKDNLIPRIQGVDVK